MSLKIRVLHGGKESGLTDARPDIRRVFFAFDISEEIRERAGRLVSSFALEGSQVKWVHQENLHLTVRFLGDVDESVFDKLKNVATSVSRQYDPFTMTIEGIGLFPNHDKPRVAWLGARDSGGTLNSFETELSRELEPLGFSPGEKRYTPHITLGRVRSDLVRGKIVRISREYHNHQFGDTKVSQLVLYESSLNTIGFKYKKLATFPLGNPQD